MAIAISGRDVVGSSDFERLTKVRATLESNARNGNTTKNDFMPKVRAMRQVTSPFLKYEFIFPPTTFTHEGYGITLNEINRPYSVPVIDTTGGKALRCSFEFVIASRLDGFFIPIDSEIKLLQEFANYGIPVDFDNVHESLSTPHWYIDNISFSHTRINTDGQTTAAQCTLSLVEFKPRSNKMILLPRFKYGKFKPEQKKKPTDDKTGNKDDTAAQIAALRAAGQYALANQLADKLYGRRG
jgi:hypothetical protein